MDAGENCNFYNLIGNSSVNAYLRFSGELKTEVLGSARYLKQFIAH